MSTQSGYKDAASFARLHKTPIRTTVESIFYGNNVVKVPDLKIAYELAKNSPGTLELTGMPIYRAEDIGLPPESNVLLFNDGSVVGRCAAARRIIGHHGVNTADLASVLREAVYGARYKKIYHCEAIIGLDEDFMVKANLAIPEGFENNLLSWMINFQYINQEYAERYEKSRPFENDGDIFLFTGTSSSSATRTGGIRTTRSDLPFSRPNRIVRPCWACDISGRSRRAR